MNNENIQTVKVSGKGQISIPNNLRQRLKIERGDNLIVVESQGKLLIEKSDRVSKKIQDDFRDLIKILQDSLKEVWENDEDEVWNDYLK